MKALHPILAIIVSAAFFAACGTTSQMTNTPPTTKPTTLIDTAGLTSGAKKFALQIPKAHFGKKSDIIKDSTPRAAKISKLQKRQPISKQLIIITDSSIMDKNIRGVQNILTFLEGELPGKNASCILTEVCFSPKIDFGFGRRFAGGYMLDTIKTSWNSHSMYTIPRMGQGYFHLSGENLAVASFIISLSLQGPGGIYDAKIVITVDSRKPDRYSLHNLNGRGLPLDHVPFDLVETATYRIVEELRKGAFSIPEAPSAKDI